jgi:formate dehydrogenase subunit gamma
MAACAKAGHSADAADAARLRPFLLLHLELHGGSRALARRKAEGVSKPSLSAILADFAVEQASLLPVLHEVQAAFGCVDAAAEAAIAHYLNLSRAEVHGVVSFYHDFTVRARSAPPHLELCRAEACQARGVEALVAAARSGGGVNRVRVRTVYCLGLCSSRPGGAGWEMQAPCPAGRSARLHGAGRSRYDHGQDFSDDALALACGADAMWQRAFAAGWLHGGARLQLGHALAGAAGRD